MYISSFNCKEKQPVYVEKSDEHQNHLALESDNIELSSLPIEIVDYIFSFLLSSPRNFLDVRQVCHPFNEIVLTGLLYFPELFLKPLAYFISSEHISSRIISNDTTHIFIKNNYVKAIREAKNIEALNDLFTEKDLNKSVKVDNLSLAQAKDIYFKKLGENDLSRTLWHKSNFKKLYLKAMFNLMVRLTKTSGHPLALILDQDYSETQVRELKIEIRNRIWTDRLSRENLTRESFLLIDIASGILEVESRKSYLPILDIIVRHDKKLNEIVKVKTSTTSMSGLITWSVLGAVLLLLVGFFGSNILTAFNVMAQKNPLASFIAQIVFFLSVMCFLALGFRICFSLCRDNYSANEENAITLKQEENIASLLNPATPKTQENTQESEKPLAACVRFFKMEKKFQTESNMMKMETIADFTGMQCNLGI
jgi:hypothetical protein